MWVKFLRIDIWYYVLYLNLLYGSLHLFLGLKSNKRKLIDPLAAKCINNVLSLYLLKPVYKMLQGFGYVLHYVHSPELHIAFSDVAYAAHPEDPWIRRENIIS